VEKALKVLIDDGRLTAGEAENFKKLIDYRNFIAHELEQLNADLSELGPLEGKLSYDYFAINKVRAARELLHLRTQGHYVITLNVGAMVFELTEKALNTGLERLRRRIERQMIERKRKLSLTP
jgi:hypothetical protein